MKKIGLGNRIIALALCLAMLLPLCACGSSQETKQLFAMDTVITLVAYGKNAKTGLDAASGIISAMDSSLDPDSDSSYTAQINTANGENVSINAQTAEMLRTALDVCEKSGGALDLSVYPLYLAWGEFKEDTGRVPSSDEIKELRKNLNFASASITEFSGDGEYSVRLPADTKISFGAVAKGCASQYAIDAMRRAGVKSSIVSLGGNVQTLGVKPDGTRWTVAVEDPNTPGTDSYLGTLTVGETAIVTSGNYQRYFIGDDGKKYHHIIDPKTGRPAENDLLSVTVVCPDGTLADCLSTAMFVLGENDALRYWRKYGGFDMILVTEDNRVVCTKGLIEVFSLVNKDRYTLKFVE